MRIAMTYDLKTDHADSDLSLEDLADLDDPAVIDAIATTLGRLGHEAIRVGNLPRLVQRLAGGERWDLVFNLAEGLYGFGREAAVPALLDAYRIPYTFADPLALAVGLHKETAKRVVRDAGLPTPDFAVVAGREDLLSIDLAYPLFAKPVAEGSSKGISLASKVATPEELAAVCTRLLDRFAQPVLVERFLPGAELTVGILGTGTASRCFGTLEIAFDTGTDDDFYSYENKTRPDWREVLSYRLVEGPLAQEAETLALAVWRLLGGRDGGRVDLKLDDEGRPSFLEINPLAGLVPQGSDLTILSDLRGMTYDELIGAIVASATERLGESAPPRAGHGTRPPETEAE